MRAVAIASLAAGVVASAAGAQESLPIRVWDPPPRIPRLVQSLQWHRHRNNDPAIRWLRDLFVDVARDV